MTTFKNKISAFQIQKTFHNFILDLFLPKIPSEIGCNWDFQKSEDILKHERQQYDDV